MNLKCIALVLLIAAPGVALANAPMPPAQDAKIEQDAVQAWGRDHADCEEWSDGCVACTKAGCSTPGIACTPKETVCRPK
ncbi:MAG: hypothetical protein KDJ44_08650 [Rhodoblastus sp.]|nr:hypothetical protein [Rhodoblastus sp.]